VSPQAERWFGLAIALLGVALMFFHLCARIATMGSRLPVSDLLLDGVRAIEERMRRTKKVLEKEVRRDEGIRRADTSN
jgi:hypothetical protein